ncbi:MAG: ribulose-bisphosphate carboxylase large chain [Thermoplasmata archaeon]|jgi:ribulose-bisphosphate carboxylase large chain|nr:ribulose-bisphosphate carboxylase large chain [Thermoplasmata archaeon]
MRGMGYTDFLELGSKPKADELVCTFRLEQDASVGFDWAAGALAAESSIGTWDPGLTTMTGEERQYGARVIKLDEAKKLVWIAYPPALFEAGNLSQLLSSVVGNVYGLKEVRKLRFVDIEMPASYARSYPGPQLGMEGVRKMTGIHGRPILGTIVKPKLGLSSDNWAKAAYNAWKGGIDFVKDDENLTSMVFNNFYDRARKVMEAKKKAERETGERKLYFCNVSAPVTEMKKRADFVCNEMGNDYVMIDVLTVGFSAVQEMRSYLDGKGIGIHAHRAMHGAFSRLEDHGIDMLPVSKWIRLLGADTLHAGTLGAGKMFTEGGKSHAKAIYDMLRGEMHGLKTVFPVASGGMHPGVIGQVWDANGGSPDFCAAAGGGVHGNPLGSEAGARAMRQAVEAHQKGMSPEEYAKTHEELAAAIKRWGTKPVSSAAE